MVKPVDPLECRILHVVVPAPRTLHVAPSASAASSMSGTSQRAQAAMIGSRPRSIRTRARAPLPSAAVPPVRELLCGMLHLRPQRRDPVGGERFAPPCHSSLPMRGGERLSPHARLTTQQT